MAKQKLVKKGKPWFRALKGIMRIRYKSPEFIFLDGEEFPNGSVILSNHEGTDAPMSLEMYLDKPMRMWGTCEMNSGLKRMYAYQSRYYFHEKKHWNLHLARLFCLIASPLTNLFYSGFDLISTYTDTRFIKTMRESKEALDMGQSIVIFPEDSSKGYLAKLEDFFAGFLVFSEKCFKQGLDVSIVVSYFKKKEKIYIFDKPILYSELVTQEKTRENIIKRLLNRCNELGTMTKEECEKYVGETTQLKSA